MLAGCARLHDSCYHFGRPCISECSWNILRLQTVVWGVQEDAHLIEPAVDNDDSVGVFAVFDGHGGKEVAAFAAIYMVCTP
jgi:hypothetical protein